MVLDIKLLLIEKKEISGMQAEKYLQEIRDLYFELERMKRRRNEISTPIGIKGMTYDSIRVQTSAFNDQLVNDVLDTLERAEELDNEIKVIRRKYLARRNEAYNRIMKLKEGQCRTFLIDYYIDCKSEKRITKEYFFTNKDTVYVLKRRALNYFKKVYKNR